MIKSRFWGCYIDCDDCPNFYSYDAFGSFNKEHFYRAIEIIQLNGWALRKDYQGKWKHYCPDCALKRMM